MPYQTLYRAFRPQSLEEVCGQQTVTRVLSRQLETGRHSHAYLLRQPRHGQNQHGQGVRPRAQLPASRGQPGVWRVRGLPSERDPGYCGDRRGLQQRRGRSPRFARARKVSAGRMAAIRSISSTRYTCSPPPRSTPLLKTLEEPPPTWCSSWPRRSLAACPPPSFPAANGTISAASARR